jgi:hypothetical protein
MIIDLVGTGKKCVMIKLKENGNGTNLANGGRNILETV